MSAEVLSKRGEHSGGHALLACRGGFEQHARGQHDFYRRRAAFARLLTLKGDEQSSKRPSRPVAFAQNPLLSSFEQSSKRAPAILEIPRNQPRQRRHNAKKNIQ